MTVDHVESTIQSIERTRVIQSIEKITSKSGASPLIGGDLVSLCNKDTIVRARDGNAIEFRGSVKFLTTGKYLSKTGLVKRISANG